VTLKQAGRPERVGLDERKQSQQLLISEGYILGDGGGAFVFDVFSSVVAKDMAALGRTGGGLTVPCCGAWLLVQHLY
jgi:hypothetical protein